MLAKRFEHILHDLGMAGLEHPLFYHAPVGIRFKIGGEEPIYLDRRAAKLKTNPAYVQGALDRAAAIYRALPAVPLLRTGEVAGSTATTLTPGFLLLRYWPTPVMVPWPSQVATKSVVAAAMAWKLASTFSSGGTG